jgi:glutathione S-transferase
MTYAGGMTSHTLYWSSNSCSLASHLVMQHVGADFNAVRVNFAKAEQRSPQYLALNPKGRVPVLVTPRGILTETPAILHYVAQLHPQAGLAPLDDPFALAQLQAFNSYLCSTVHVHHAHRVRGERWSDDPAVVEALKIKVTQNMHDSFAYIEQAYLQTGPYVMGEALSTGDFYLFTLSTWLAGDGVDIRTLPKAYAHQQRMLQLPAVQQVVALHATPVA